jgi:hypothetical protein
MRSHLLALIALAACERSDNGTHLDALDDSPIDTLMDEAVTITMTNAGAPVAGVTVYFQNADSSMVATMTTDVTGTASAVMAAGGFVTAIDPYGASTGFDKLATVSGVKPGDHLLLSSAEPVEQITFTVTLPTDPSPSVARYEITSNCGFSTLVGDSKTGSMSMRNCHGTADLMVLAENANFETVDFLYMPAIAVADGVALDLSQRAYTPAVSRAYTYTDTPVDPESNNLDGLGVQDFLISSHAQVIDMGFVVPLIAQPPVSFTRTLPTLAGTIDLVHSSQAPNAGLTTRNVLEWGPYSSTYALDFQANLVPDFGSDPQIDVTNHAVTWTEVAGAEPADFVIVTLDLNRTSESREWVWTLAAAHSTAPVLPELPTTIHDFNIAPTDASSVYDLVIVKAPGGYDAVRANVLTITAPADLISGGAGRLSYSNFHTPLTWF